MYVFSTFVMSGLNRTEPVEAVTAMRGINAEANASEAFLLTYLGAAVLALVAIPAVAIRARHAKLLVWIFNIEGTLDLIVAILLATIFNAAPFMGPAYWIPAFWVPALLVTHYIAFIVLRRRWPQPA